MSEIGGKHVFPGPVMFGDRYSAHSDYQYGMTLRQWYAGMAMQAIIINPLWQNKSVAEIVEEAYVLADAMIAHEEEADAVISSDPD